MERQSVIRVCLPTLALFFASGCSSSDDSASEAHGGRGGVAGAGPTTGGSTVGGAGASRASGGAATSPAGAGGRSSSGGSSSVAAGASGLGGSSGANGGAGENGAAGAGPGVECTEPFVDDESDLSGCVATVSGIKFKFFPLDKSTPLKRVAIFFHGDTAGDWRDWAFPEIVDWCKKRAIFVIAPLSPVKYDDDPPDAPSYGAASTSEAKKVGVAIEDFLKAYNAAPDNLLYWSLSGGSWFITSSFLPLMGARLPGVFALSCGASDWWERYAWDIKSAARAKNKLLFNYGTEDFLRPGEEASAAKFKNDGFSVTTKTYAGAEHCDHPMSEPTIAFWEANL